MKLSINWIFDHLKAKLEDIDIKYLFDQLSSKTAEIENFREINIDLDLFSIVKIKKIDQNQIESESFEWKKNIILPFRKDILVDQYYLIKKENKNYNFASLVDLGSHKEGLLTAISCSPEDLKGNWKNSFESKDYILELDNKAVTNRPDLWGHRGFAREISVLLDKELLPEDIFLADKPIKNFKSSSNGSNGSNGFSIEINPEPAYCANFCKRLAGLYINKIENSASLLKIATRLARIDSKPIDMIVDMTNYVMYDIGQPMHAFDADKIESKKIVGQCAQQGEKLLLLDGQKIELSNFDYVITDGKKPLGLAGIMGGQETSVSKNTNSIVIESANFDSTVIRKSSARLKLRTESSARFEKSLDPNQNTIALLRFLKLLETYKINFIATDSILSVGQLAQESVITLNHDFIVAKIGMIINPDLVEKYLAKLGFGVKSIHDNKNIVYTITVPTFRNTKDILIKEDIVEEIARLIGYNNIPHILLTKQVAPFDIKIVERVRKIKEQLAFGLKMHEVQTYAFFDEPYLKEIKWEPTDALELLNPFSDYIKKLVTSLIPNLFKCVSTNKSKQDYLSFFELNRIWFYDKNLEKIVERKELAGIFFDNKNILDFYYYKNYVNSIFDIFNINIDWQKPKSEKIEKFYNLNQTAQLVYKDRVIGLAGIVSTQFLKNISATGSAFIFEIDADFLLNLPESINCFKPLNKYQEVEQDISILVSNKIQVAELESIILKSDNRILSVKLVDFFSKEDWVNQKSITFRFIVYDNNKTLTKEDIDSVWQAVTKNLEKIDAQVR